MKGPRIALLAVMVNVGIALVLIRTTWSTGKGETFLRILSTQELSATYGGACGLVCLPTQNAACQTDSMQAVMISNAQGSPGGQQAPAGSTWFTGNNSGACSGGYNWNCVWENKYYNPCQEAQTDCGGSVSADVYYQAPGSNQPVLVESFEGLSCDCMTYTSC